MVNGYPSPTILGTVNLDPSNVNISDDALTATTFVFETPVYLLERKEYCFALLTSSVEYKVWLSEMGKDDLTGERISKQPYAGVLFKSQNASTWTTAEMQDMKFKIYRAKFDINETPSIIMNVDTSGNLFYNKLRRDPIELTVNNGRMKVYHKNHGMYDSASYVQLKGVSSEKYANLDADYNGVAGSAITLSGSYNDFKYLATDQSGVVLGASTTFTVTSNANLKVGDIVTTASGNDFAGNTRVTDINGTTITISAAALTSNTVTVIFTNPIDGKLPSNSNPAYVKIGECVYSYNPLTGISNELNNQYTITTIALVEGTAPSSGFKKDSGWQAEHYVVNGIPLTEVNKIHNQLEYITLDSYQIDLSSLTRTLATTNTTFGGANVYGSKNIAYHSMMPLIGYRELPGTAIDATFRSTTGSSIGTSAFSVPASGSVPSQRSYKRDSAFSPVALNEHNYYQTPRVIASAINEERQMVGAKSGQLQFTLSSTSDNLSPVIDQDRMSIVTTGNRVTDFDGTFKKEFFFNDDSTYIIGESPKQDFNGANYITKLITVANECTSLRIDFAAFNNSETDIDVYVKLLTGDETNPGDQSWEELTAVNYSGSKNEFDFIDYTYQKDLSGKQFTQYQIKLRMRSRNAAVVPIIKDLRCIALA